MKRTKWIRWRWLRWALQFAALALLLWLFRRTAYTGEDLLAGGESIFFRLDPLAGAAATLASRQIITLFWPALVVVILTVFLGRFFCGWICPLGTLLDGFYRIFRPVFKRTNLLCGVDGNRRLRSARYILLIAVLFAALFSYPLVGLVDPFALLFRAMTFWGDPILYRGAGAGLDWIDGRWGAEAIEPFVEDHLMPFRAAVFRLAGASAVMLAVIFALELAARRFWCRYLCPLGAMLGLLGRKSLVKRLPAGVCKNCGDCASLCRMGALDDGLAIEDCTLCMDCIDLCPKGIARFSFDGPATGGSATGRLPVHYSTRKSRPVDLSRRGALAGLAVGAAIPGVAAAVELIRSNRADPYLLRPPGAADEKTFLDLCVRCGECMKVCPTGVLQPALLESGLQGMFSPRLIPRFIFEQTYCEYTCTLCGQVCPSGAIPRLSETAKHARPIGLAYFDHARCLPWGKQTPCVRCEEMCPVPDKAIKILNTFTIKGKDGEEVTIQQPYVDRDLCVGCGICESNCPVKGISAIRVRRADAPDPGTETMLDQKPEGAVEPPSRQRERAIPADA